jgi:hypothetical protein
MRRNPCVKFARKSWTVSISCVRIVTTKRQLRNSVLQLKSHFCIAVNAHSEQTSREATHSRSQDEFRLSELRSSRRKNLMDICI